MTFNFESEVDIDFKFDYLKLYEDVCLAVIDNEKCPYEAEINLTLVNDESIREINKENRQIDKATDVLSFPFVDYESPSDFDNVEECMDVFNPETGELILGDIVISIEHVKSQAEEYGHSFEREYAFLIAHSMLHLCGYDHMKDDERMIMEAKQKEIMELLYDRYPALKVD